jgi:hypothetical protein
MRAFWVIPILLAAVLLAASPGRHWEETANETIWRGRYRNCDHGYEVYLPKDGVGHGSLPPAPNHGILISAADPGITAEVTLEDDRLIEVYDSNDAMELGSARAELDWEFDQERKKSETLELVEKHDTGFHGLPAAYARYRTGKGGSAVETEELVAYRTSKEIGPIFYVILLRTPPEHHAQDRRLYLQIRDGFRILPAPKGECSND